MNTKVKNDEIQRKIYCLIPYAIFFITLCLTFFDANNYWNLTVFDREIGITTLHAHDIDKRITMMYLFSFGIPLIIFLFVGIVAKYFRSEKMISVAQQKCGGMLAVAGTVQLIVYHVMGVAPGKKEFPLPILILTVLILVYFVQTVWGIYDERNYTFLMGLICSEGLLCMSAILAGWKKSVPDGVYAIVFTIGLLLTIVLCKNIGDRDRMLHAYWPIALFPILLSVYFESRYLCAQRGRYFPAKSSHILFLVVVLLLFCTFYYVWLRKHNTQIRANSNYKWYLPILLGFGMISFQIKDIWVGNLDLFESANDGMTVWGWFRYGEIPFLENFDAHMFSYGIGKLVYGALSGDIHGAMWLGYSMVPLTAVAVYILWKQFVSPEVALILVLFYPWTMDNSIYESGLCLLVASYLPFLLKKEKIRWYFVFWIMCALGCFYQISYGICFGVGAAVMLFVTLILQKRMEDIKKYIISLLATVTMTIAVMVLLLFVKKIDVLPRIREIISTMSSNSSWAFEQVGAYGANYSIVYFIFPMMVVFFSVVIFFIWREDNWKDSQVPVILALTLSYIINFQRSLTRHSIIEGYIAWFPLMGNLILALSLQIWYIWKHRQKLEEWREQVGLSVTYTVLLFVITYIGGDSIDRGESIYLLGMKNSVQISTFYQDIDGERVKETPELTACYVDIKKLFDATLAEDETFIDFSRNTLLYGLTGRKKPVYVNQSPELVSGEFGQQCFIKECEAEKTPYVLAWTNIELAQRDGVPFAQKFYLISEYISQKFVPLCEVGEYTVWCRKDKLSEKQELLEKAEKDLYIPWSDENVAHTYNLSKLPYVWGEFDGSDPIVISELSSRFQLETNQAHAINLPSSDSYCKEKGNYIVINAAIEGEQEKDFSMYINNTSGGSTAYYMTLLPGAHQYTIRVSGDYNWYLTEEKELVFINPSDTPINVLDVSLCKGDTIQ